MKVVKSFAAWGMPTVSHVESSKLMAAPSSPLGTCAWPVWFWYCLMYFHGCAPRFTSTRSEGARVTACAVTVAPRHSAASTADNRARFACPGGAAGCIVMEECPLWVGPLAAAFHARTTPPAGACASRTSSFRDKGGSQIPATRQRPVAIGYLAVHTPSAGGSSRRSNDDHNTKVHSN